VRLAWISQSPGRDGAAIRRDLAAYLSAVLNQEWPALADGAGCEATHAGMSELRYRVRGIAAEPDVPASVSNDLTTAADAIAVTRVERLNAAARDLPTRLFLLAFVSGVVLTLNAVVLALHLDHAHGLAIAGIVALIPLDLALSRCRSRATCASKATRSSASSTTSPKSIWAALTPVPGRRCRPARRRPMSYDDAVSHVVVLAEGVGAAIMVLGALGAFALSPGGSRGPDGLPAGTM
jgi:hypothetical protein